MNLFGTRLSKRAVVSMFPLYMCATVECGDFEFKWGAALHTEGQWNMTGGATGWANLLEVGADMELWDDGGLLPYRRIVPVLRLLVMCRDIPTLMPEKIRHSVW